MNDVEDAAGRLRGVVRSLRMKADALKEKDAPSHSEHMVMVWLDQKGAMTPRALADAQHVRPQTVQQTLDALGRRKFITRADHPTDRRQILISLSATGRKALAKVRATRQAWLVGELRQLPARELKTVIEALAIIERFSNKPIETPKSK